MNELTLPDGFSPQRYAIWDNVLVRISDDQDIAWFDEVDEEWVFTTAYLLGAVDSEAA